MQLTVCTVLYKLVLFLKVLWLNYAKPAHKPQHSASLSHDSWPGQVGQVRT